MPTLLHLDSSPLENSISRELTREFVKTWKASHTDGMIIYRDLAAHTPTPVNAMWIGASHTPEAQRTPEQKAALALSDELIGEMEKATEYVFGVAMHNFSIPSVLKLWIDQVARSGRTFAYGESGVQGLLQGKNATILIASGGVYERGTPAGALNFVEPYLGSLLRFLGVTEVEFIAAGGTAQIMAGSIDRQAFLKSTLDRVRERAAA